MHACADAVYGIENITFHRASNVREGCVAAKTVKTQSEILAQLKILQKMNLLEDLEKCHKNRTNDDRSSEDALGPKHRQR